MHKIVMLQANVLNYNPVLEIDEVEKLLDKVIPYTGGRYNKEDIKEALHSNQMQLWLAFDAINEKIDGLVVSHFSTYPRKKVLTLLLCSGKNLDSWYYPMLSDLEKFAVINECSSIETGGRKGWIKRMKKDNYHQKFYLVEKEVCHG
jgi:hypothetical protein